MRFLRKLMIGLGVLAAVPLAAQGPVQQIAAKPAEQVSAVPPLPAGAAKLDAADVEAWLDGHSQRAAHGGSPEAILDILLSDGPLAAGDLRRNGPSQEVPWHVRLHDRSCMYYSAHLVAARKTVK